MRKYLRHIQGESLKAQLIRGAGGSAGIQVVNLLLTLVSGVLLARTLGPESYGTYAFVLSIITLLSLPAKAGLPTLLVRETAKNQLNKDWGLMRGLLKASNLFAIGYSVIVVTIVGSWLLLRGDDTLETATLLWALLLLPLMAFEAVRTGTLRGLRWVLSAQAPEQIVRPATVILLVGSVVLLGSELSAVRAIQFNVIGALLAFTLGVFLLLKALPQRAKTAESKYNIKPWAASLLPLSLFAGLKLLDSQVSILFLGFLATSEEVGLFRVAATGAALVAFGLNAVNMAMAPQIARLYNSGELEKLQRTITLSTRVVALVSFPVAIVLIVFGGPIIDIVFGQEYVSAAALTILCLGQLVNASAGSVALVLNMTGNDKSTVIGAALALIVNLILCLILVPFLGLVGAAIGYSISLSVWNVLLMFMVRKKLGINTFVFAK
ncbi:flippase [Marinobacter piscensis]|uniref:flippase n=1 Tax=Marinobacter piscensis TaxID=1562308 RepID=UPI0024831A9C|nr:flippase [Marinobacter piscensis]